ncbi:MAG: heme NO-binding domain-containing protein [Magnetococcales bacterium]|nr:heme NO-binding domain-containing protein [Magnetococcales bacterium]
MHGIIFLALEDFLESRSGKGAWARAMREANLVEQSFSPDRFYPDEGAADLFAASAKVLKLPMGETLEQLGCHMSPGLIEMGRSMGLIQPEWRTLDILERLNKDILSAFRTDGTGLKPPDIRTYRLKYGEIAAAYVSDRRLCQLFKGIVKGVGAFFNEPIRIEERVCMLESAPLCRMSIYLDDPALKNHVDITREFQTVHSRIQEIRFYNQFAGVAVVNQGLVLQYGPKGVLVQIQPESLLAMREEGGTYLALPHLHLGLKAAVAQVDMTQRTALLKQIVSTDGPIGRRILPRVVPVKPLPIELRIHKQTLRGWIANISESGLCIVLRADPILNETIIFTPLKVRFTLPVQTVDSEVTTASIPKIVLDGNILNIEEREGRHSIRIVFQPYAVNEAHQIQRYYRERETAAFQQLNALIALIK